MIVVACVTAACPLLPLPPPWRPLWYDAAPPRRHTARLNKLLLVLVLLLLVLQPALLLVAPSAQLLLL
jgi:hypothetical protein